LVLALDPLRATALLRRPEPALELFDPLCPDARHGGRILSHVCHNPAVPFSALDTAAVARTLSQIAEQPEDLADAYFERRQEVELRAEGEAPGLRVWREEGLAVRLVREGKTWLAARDPIEPRPFAEALRQIARALPSATYPEPALPLAPWAPPEAGELLDFPGARTRAVRAHHVGFPLRLTVRRRRRSL